ncbi:MATH domain and coiled-coil domain-containing protein At1g31390-like [Tripterygium wilfordii]|uniref:MATH domain and coiled-coil domain-containing protein At1g31390-like n=1 Tax=Tripterygium wilfordii TaxID=458696 RepID=UPI0018F81293|nr:MATH domain and coiled-coil domain-containing protein At1g31390-like [Tripterygium wilfordii]
MLLPMDQRQRLEVRTYKREIPPNHFMFHILSFSLLSEAGMERCETDDFEVGGYKWCLAFYPNGNKDEDADGYISLYLVIKETEKLPVGWNVDASFKFLVFDHIQHEFLTIEGVDGTYKRFDATKTEWGFSQALSLETLKKESNGYMEDDMCIFGAEVFIVQFCFKMESLKMMKYTHNNVMTWKIKDFSKLNEMYYNSEVFDLEESEWMITLFPKGNGLAKGKFLSLYLMLEESENLLPGRKQFVQFKLRVRNQIQDSAHAEMTSRAWLTSGGTCGFEDFLSLEDLENPFKGYIKNDCLTVEAEILHMSESGSTTFSESRICHVCKSRRCS